MIDDLGGLAAFLAVASKQSFRAAGEELGVTASAVSQTVRRLETRLGLQLFSRTTRSVALTEAGEHLYAGLRPAFADVRAVVDSLESLRSRPAGLLRLNVSSIAESFLAEGVVAEFLAEYPDIRLDVTIDDGHSDVANERYDAAVALGEVVAKDMVAVSVSAEQRQIVVASPKYLGTHGKPKHPRDLHRHSCIGWRYHASPTPYRWEFSEEGKDFSIALESRVLTNDMNFMIRLALDGAGVTLGMEETFRPYIDRRELVPVLEKYCPPFPGFFLYYPSRAQTPPKLRALVEFLRKRMRAKKKR